MERLPTGVVSPEAQRLEDFLNRHVIGQDRAARYIREYMEIAWADMCDPRRPIANFLFTGPSGVGKTEMAKAMAEFFFGKPHRLTIIDCNEFTEDHEVAALRGAPPGYVGHGKESAQLSQWNLDRHDVEHLCETGKFFNDFVAKKKEWLEEGERRKAAAEKSIAETEAKVRQLETEIENMGRSFDEIAKRVQAHEDTQENAARLRVKIQKDIEAAADEIKRHKEEAQAKRSYLRKILERIEVLEKIVGDLKDVTNLSPEERVREFYELMEADEYVHSAGRYASIVLWNEFDKSSGALQDMLLSIMDEGKLTRKDPPGDVVYFNNTINIFTCNVFSEEIGAKRMGFAGSRDGLSQEAIRKRDKDFYDRTRAEIQQFFRPELVNRLSKIVFFRPLDAEAMHRVLDLRIDEINAWQPIKLKLLPSAKDLLVAEAMKYPQEGARLMTRRVEQFIATAVAPLKNADFLKDGDTVIVKLGKDGQLEFYKK